MPLTPTPTLSSSCLVPALEAHQPSRVPAFAGSVRRVPATRPSPCRLPGSPCGFPVVGMVGGGQLARMTQAAAIALGVRLRVLAESPDAARRPGRPRRAGRRPPGRRDASRRSPPAATSLTFDHEHVPTALLRAARGRRRRRAPRARRARARAGQDRDARAADARSACRVPALARGRASATELAAFAAEVGLPARAQDPARRLRRQGRPRRSRARPDAAGLAGRAAGDGRPARRGAACRSAASSRRSSRAAPAARRRPGPWSRPCRSTGSAARSSRPPPAWTPHLARRRHATSR